MMGWWLAWVVQGVALVLALGGILRLAPRTNASTRCALWSVLILSTVAMGFIGAPVSARPDLSNVAGRDPLFLIPAPPDVVIAVAAMSWALVAALLLVRVRSGVREIQTIRRRCRPLSPELEDQLPLWRQVRSEGRRTELVISDTVPGAAVLGFRRPSIVLPAFLVGALLPEDLDQVVLHEYAHVRRWDDWSRLGQMVVEALVWMHPAVRFAARRLNLERELACDEWVVARTGNAIAYARCLARAAEARGTHLESGFNVALSTLGPALFGRKHELRRRVDRLLARSMNTQPAASRWRVAVGACALLLLAFQVRAIPIVAEIAEVEWLPMPRAPLAGVSPSRRADFPETAAIPADPRPRRRAGAPQRARTEEAAAPGPAITITRIFQTQPIELDAPVLAATRYDGSYTAGAAPEPVNTAEGRWGAAAASIGTAGRKTGMGMAAVFARAGGSVARRF